MIPELAIIGGSICLTATVGYWGWTNIRVWLLRQRLFTIRGQLFDAAREQGALNHPHYCAARQSMNSIIRIAPLLSLPWFKTLLKHAGKGEVYQGEQLDFVNDYMARFSLEIVRYLFLQTASGWWYTATTVAIRAPMESVRRAMWEEAKHTSCAMRSEAIRAADEIPVPDHLATA